MKLPRTIYAIQHNVTKRIYIGSSSDIKNRYCNHMSLLRNGKHNIEDMQSDFVQYGEDYSLFALEEIEDFEDRKKEYDWMKKYKSYIRGIGYNYKDPAIIRSFSKIEVPLKEGMPEPFEPKEE